MLNFARKKEQSKPFSLGIETIFYLIVIPLIVAIFLKAVLDVDDSYDPGWYHLPFAARLGGILPKEMFIGDEKWFEPRFDGFPLLAHFLQGLFWRVTGRIQSTNLVAFFSVIGYFAFLRVYFQVPLYLSAIALFSIPLFLTNATTSFVDLFGNVGISILVMMTYSFYKNKDLPSFSELFVAFLGAAIAVNTKTQLQPLGLFILIFTGSRLAWLYWQQHRVKHLVKVLPLTILAILIIFASPIKNTLIHQNPLYPIKVEIGGVVLNHKLSPEAYETGNRQQKWINSVLEINAPHFWTADQWSSDFDRNRRGGFFGLYVVFNILLLLGLLFREAIQNKYLLVRKDRAKEQTVATSKTENSRAAKIAFFTAIAMSIVPINFPQSHELRYFMYWMICLVSLNLALISLPKNRELWGRWLKPKYMGLIYLVFLTIVLIRTDGTYIKVKNASLDKHVTFGVKPDLIAQIKPNERVCLLSKHMGEEVQGAPMAALKYAFLYSSYFHPELDYDYSIQATLDPANCGDRTIIPQPQPEKTEEQLTSAKTQT